ncbi:MAG: hypothetical protein LBK67_00040 [Coriobacteriales bacterium]|nr:hypothetical protein [Coriobacteriales bacterium]
MSLYAETLSQTASQRESLLPAVESTHKRATHGFAVICAAGVLLSLNRKHTKR